MEKNNKNKTGITSILLLSLFVVKTSHAEFDPAVIKAGGVDIVPVVSISESYDSNILYAETTKESDTVTEIRPEVSATVESGANEYSVKVGASIGRYAKSSEDDFVDSNVSMNIHQSFTRKAILNVDVERMNEHESRGLNYGKGKDLPEPDKYHINQAKAKFSYGSRDSIGRIVFNAITETRNFDSRRSITKTRDLQNTGGGVTFYYHFMPKTSLLFELSQRELTYRHNELDNSNSIEQRVFAGTRWDITALTSGTAKAGLLEKNFEDSAKSDRSTFSWEVGARWSPLTYSVFDIITKGALEESEDVNDYSVESKNVLIQWVHFWNKALDTTLHVNVTNRDYQQSGREDKLVSSGVKLKYNFRRWLDASASYRYSESDSSTANFSYDKNVLTLGLIASL